jgi:hypothetical protein
MIQINPGLLLFLKNTEDENRLFILGDTASGKTTGTLSYFMEKRETPTIYYITTRKADLSEKKIFISENMKNYGIYFHDKPNSIEKSNIGGSIRKTIHLMTVEKALYYIVAQLKGRNSKYSFLEKKASFNPPDLFILDEIDSLSENSNYELLTSIINQNFPTTKVIYISAVVNENYVKNKLKDFLQLKNPEKDCYSIEKNEKKITRNFVKINNNLKEAVLKYLKIYSQNKKRFRQTIFIIPSIKRITELPSLPEITALSGFKKNIPKLSSELKEKIEGSEELSNWKDVASKELKTAIAYNFGIMYSGTNSTDRNILLKLFNMGKIQLLISTNVIERGINVKANSLFLFETKYVTWTDRQIINFFGRINRETSKELDIPGNFFFISSNRQMYDFSIIDKRNLVITSSLEDYKISIYCSYFKGLSNFLLKPKQQIRKSIEMCDYLEPYSDSIKYSIPPEIIKNNYKYIADFLSLTKEADDKRESLKKIVIKIKETVIIENILKYLYMKSLENIYGFSEAKMFENIELLINEAVKLKTHHVLKITETGKDKILQNEKENLTEQIKKGLYPKNSMFFFSKKW